MDAIPVQEARLRIARWIEDGEAVLGLLPGFFDEHERMRETLEAAERDASQLRRELGEAREHIDTLRAEVDGLRREREEVAEAVAESMNRLMNDALRRLREPSPHRGPVSTEPRYS
jgi:chromosome segregation ATPase